MPVRRGKSADAVAERRSPNSPLRTLGKSGGVAPKLAANGTRGNFRPY